MRPKILRILEFRYRKDTVLKNRRKGKKFLMVDIKLPIPKIPDDPDPIELTLKSGDQLFIVGPKNLFEKSKLISESCHFTGKCPQNRLILPLK